MPRQQFQYVQSLFEGGSRIADSPGSYWPSDSESMPDSHSAKRFLAYYVIFLMKIYE
jgi:hypothetical protein